MRKPRRAYSYIRFSSPEQAKGASLKRQLEASERYAQERGLDLDTSLRDLGRSAYKGDHLKGSLGAFRQAVISGAVPRGSVLIVESLDRLSRAKVPAALSQFIQLLEAGVEIVTLSDHRSYSADQLNADWTPLVISLAVMARAHEESDTKSKRIADVWQRRRADAATKPMIATRPAWLDWRNGRFVVNKKKAAIVRRAFEMVANDGLGLYGVMRRFNAEGVPTLLDSMRDVGWTKSTVANIIVNPAAYGELQPKQRRGGKREAVGDLIPDYYPAVIARELFQRAQQARALNRGSGGVKSNCVPNLLLGRVFCAECGDRARVVTRRDRKNSYVCGAAYRHHKSCGNRTFNLVRWIEQGVMDGVQLLGHSPAADDADPRAVALREEIAQLADRLKTAKARVGNLITAMADDPIPEVVIRVRTMGREIEAWEARKADAAKELDGLSGRATIGEHIEAVTALRQAAYCDDYDARDAARSKLSLSLRQAVTSVHVGADRVSRVVLRDGAVSFSITAGKLHDVVFAVRDQRWRLLPDGDMERIAA